VSETSYR